MSEKSPKFRECVSRKMSKLKDEGGRPEDQMIAIALNTCREKFGIKRGGDALPPNLMWCTAIDKYIDLNMVIQDDNS